MKKRGAFCLTSLSLLFLLTACGFKLDDATLSNQGGVWSAGGDFFQFEKDGKLTLYTNNKEKIGTGTYKVIDDKDDYLLKMEANLDTLAMMGGQMTIKVPKKDNTNQKFTGTAEASGSLGTLPIGQTSGRITFTKEKSDVLNKE